MPAPIDWRGRVFGMLTVLARAARSLNPPDTYWLCRCTCGNYKLIHASSLRSGRAKSCGCRQGAIKHGQYQSATYSCWEGMIARCYNPNNHSYPWYGALGIKVCDRWRGSVGFQNFLADMGERPKGLTLERKRNTLDYSPDNCRWATWAEQRENRRKWGTVTMGRKHGYRPFVTKGT